MVIFIGIIIGLVVGLIQLWLLFKFVALVIKGSGFVLLGLFQLIFPFLALLIVSLVFSAALMSAGIVVVAVLLVGVIVQLIMKKAFKK